MAGKAQLAQFERAWVLLGYVPPMPRFVAILLFSLTFVGCGGRSDLKVYGSPRDGGPDSDAAPPPPLEVDCGRMLRYTTPRLPITMTAEVTSFSGIASQGWSLLASPEGSIATNTPTFGPTTTLDPDLIGFYALRFEAMDTEGRVESCDVQVEAIVGPPRAICPDGELRVPANEFITLEGGGFDDEAVVSYQWTLRDGPSEPELTAPTSPITQFRAAITGVYRMELDVADADGSTHACTAIVQVVGAPQVFCPEVIEAPTRQPLRIDARAIDDTGIASHEWTLLEQPDRSRATIRGGAVEGDTYTATMTPDRQGEYLVRFEVTDEDGLSASCEILVIGLPTPPDAICTDVNTTPLTRTNIPGGGEDDGEIVRYQWALVGLPPGSTARPPMPATEPDTIFTPDLAGEYRLELTVTDDDGESASCVALVRAVASEGLRIEMFWDSDGTDIDLHLLNSGSMAWRTTDDCYFGNCTSPPYPSWGRAGSSEDDPNLDIDDTDGFGPENINIDTPANGTYRVAAYAYRGTGTVTVRIYCGGSTTEPRATFGPTTIRGPGGSMHDFWRVADVTIRGDTCSISEIGRVDRVNHDGAPFPP